MVTQVSAPCHVPQPVAALLTALQLKVAPGSDPSTLDPVNTTQQCAPASLQTKKSLRIAGSSSVCSLQCPVRCLRPVREHIGCFFGTPHKHSRCTSCCLCWPHIAGIPLPSLLLCCMSAPRLFAGSHAWAWLLCCDPVNHSRNSMLVPHPKKSSTRVVRQRPTTPQLHPSVYLMPETAQAAIKVV
jgi:hypothetical protein